MIFEATAIGGAYVIRLERREDDRGFFARTCCDDELSEAGIHVRFVQQSIARSTRAGTLRGMHLQVAPHEEAKLVRCVRGAIFDVFVDLREESPTFLRIAGVRLDAERGDAVFVPGGCAHGYQTLTDDTDVLYAMSTRYAANAARSVAWNDSELGIAWPLPNPIMSAVDRDAPSLRRFLADRAAGQREVVAASANAAK